MDGTRLAELLDGTPAKIEGWRAQARQLHELLVPARIDGRVSEELHESIERTCSAIYAEIAALSAVTSEVSATSVAAAAELAPLNEELRLVLLEITELSTELYAVGSPSAPPDLSIAGKV